ncbi:hypothetical protein ABZ752_15375 [Streptomyces roseifaciens]
MTGVEQWHASPDRAATPVSDERTGEVRVPLALFHFDQLKGSAELVLTRMEGQRLYYELGCALGLTGLGGLA